MGSVPLELHTNCVPLSGGDILISPGAFVWGQVVLKVEVPEFLKLIFPLLWLCWVFVAAHFPLVAVAGPTPSLCCALLTAEAPLAVAHSLQGVGLPPGRGLASRAVGLPPGPWASAAAVRGPCSHSFQALSSGSTAVVHVRSCSEACGLFPGKDRTCVSCTWQADSA